MAKTVLIYLGHHEINGIDEAISYMKKGDRVILLSCDKSIGICHYNPYGNKNHCRFCQYSKVKHLKKYLPKKFDHYFVSDYMTDEINKETINIGFDYEDVKELKKVVFHDIEIGYGSFSTYVTLTRNINPEFNHDFKEYINYIMRKEILLTLVLESLVKKIKIGLVIFHNGRFAQYKPLLGVSKARGINYIATEVVFNSDGSRGKNYFYNDVPHSVEANTEKLYNDWELADRNNREKIGKSFYEKRRNGILAGDRAIYTNCQVLDVLPKNWDSSKENIAIYTSSEDEYFSISKEFDTKMLFPSQFEGLKTIFEKYKNDSQKHFYLRIHPNLKNMPLKFYSALYELDYENVSIISPSSSISSYTLLDNSDKIIVFGSTIGIESVFWGKPVIGLNYCEYVLLNVVYTPETANELWSLIEEKNLRSKYNDNVIKFGYYMMKDNYPKTEFIDSKVTSKSFFGKEIEAFNAFSLFGSIWFHTFAIKILNFLARTTGLTSTFKNIPS